MDREQLINAMTQKGHTRSTAEGAIAGRGMEDLWREYIGPTGGGSTDTNAFFDQQRANREALEQRQRQEEKSFLTDFSDFIGGRESVGAIGQRLGEEQGLPQLRQTSQRLMETLDRVPETLKQASSGFDVSENQLRRMISAERQEQLPEAQRAVGQVQSAQEAVNQQLGYEMAQRQEELLPWQTRASMVSDRLAREVTNFRQEQQSQLGVLLQKMQNQQALDMVEAQKLANLALQEDQYEKMKDYYMFQQNNKTAGGGATTFNFGSQQGTQEVGQQPASQPVEIDYFSTLTPDEQREVFVRSAHDPRSANEIARDLIREKEAGPQPGVYTGTGSVQTQELGPFNFSYDDAMDIQF